MNERMALHGRNLLYLETLGNYRMGENPKLPLGGGRQKQDLKCH